jgi:hypothetical protein
VSKDLVHQDHAGPEFTICGQVTNEFNDFSGHQLKSIIQATSQQEIDAQIRGISFYKTDPHV